MTAVATTLKGITWEHPRGYDCQVAAAAEYERLTGVRVEWEFRSLQAFADAPLDDLTARYDLLVIDHPHVPLAAHEGLLAPLDGAGHDDELAELAAHSVGQSHPSYRYQGHQYGLATDAAAQVSVYRPDLCDAPPTSWPEVLDLAASGRVLWAAKPIDAMSTLYTLTANSGRPCVVDGESAFLDPDVARAALDWMQALAALVPDWCLEANPIQVAQALATSDEWSYAPLSFGYVSYSRPGAAGGGKHGHRLKHTNIPGGAAGPVGALLGGAGVAVSSRSSAIPAAIDYAFWVATPAVQAGVYYDAGGQPGHGLAWEDQRLNADSWDFFTGTRDTLEGAYVRPALPGYVEFQDTMSPWVTAALRGELTHERLIERINALAATLMGEGADPAQERSLT